MGFIFLPVANLGEFAVYCFRSAPGPAVKVSRNNEAYSSGAGEAKLSDVTRFSVGQEWDGSSRSDLLVGDIADIAVYGAAHDDATAASVVAELMTLYGLNPTFPTLSSPTGTATGTTTADGSVSTDTGTGTLYAIVQESSVGAPSVAQIQAGLDGDGSAAPYDTSQAVSGTGAQAVAATGLTADTEYVWCYQQDDGTTDSAVVTSAAFSTDPIPGLRSTLAGVYVASSHIPQLRSTLAGVYVASTTLHYQLRTTLAGVYVVESLPLPPAYLTVVALDYEEAQLYWTIPGNMLPEDGLYVYRYTESGAALDPSMRVADLAAGTEAYDDGGVPRPGWTYYWKVASYYGAAEFASVEVSAVMPSRLGVAYVTNSSAGLMFQFEPTSLAVRYRVTTADDEDFASPILDETVAGDLRGIYVAEGLADVTDYIAEAQEQAADGTWGDWHYAFFTTVATPAFRQIGEWTSHHDGSIVSGTINVAWDLAWGGRLSGWRAYLVEARAATDPDGDWTTLAEDAALPDAEVGGISIDTSIWPDGFAFLRLTAHDADDSEQGQMTLVFLVDNAGVFAATSGGIGEGDYMASLVGCGGTAVHSEVFMDRYGEPMFGGHLGALNVRCPGEFCVIPPDMQQSGEDGATAAVAGHFTATGTWLWWMNLQIEGSFFAVDFIDQAGAARVTVMVGAGNCWPVYPCNDSNGHNLRCNGAITLIVDGAVRSKVSTSVKGGWPGNCSTMPIADLIWATVRRVAGSADQWDITYQAPFRTPAVVTEGVTDGYGVHAATQRFTLPGLDCVCCVRFRAGRGAPCSLSAATSGGTVTFLEAYGATFFGDSCVDCVICGGPPPVCVVDRVFEVHGAEGDTFDLSYYPDGGDPAEAVSLATAAEPGMFVWDVHDLDQGTYFVLVTPTDGSDPWTIQVEVRYLELPARTYYIEPAAVPARPTDCSADAAHSFTADTTQ